MASVTSCVILRSWIIGQGHKVSERSRVHERNHTFFKVCDNVAQEVGRLHTENFADDDVNLQR